MSPECRRQGGVAPGQVGPKGSGVLGRSAGCGQQEGAHRKEQGWRTQVCSDARGGGTRGCGAEAGRRDRWADPTHLCQQEASSGLDTAPTLTSSHLLYCTLGSWGSMRVGS